MSEEIGECRDWQECKPELGANGRGGFRTTGVRAVLPSLSRISTRPWRALLPFGSSLRDHEESLYSRTPPLEAIQTTPCPDFL